MADAAQVAAVLGGTATLTTWIKTTQVGDGSMWKAPGITGTEQSGGSNDSFWGWIDNNGRIGVQVGDAKSAKSTAPINDGQWHHVAFTRDATTGVVQVYVDGVLNQSVTTWTGLYTKSFRSIGRIENTGRHFQGALDELRVYNRVLTPAEVSTVMNAGITQQPQAAVFSSTLIGSSGGDDELSGNTNSDLFK